MKRDLEERAILYLIKLILLVWVTVGAIIGTVWAETAHATLIFISMDVVILLFWLDVLWFYYLLLDGPKAVRQMIARWKTRVKS